MYTDKMCDNSIMVVTSASYSAANMGTTPQWVRHKMVALATPVA